MQLKKTLIFKDNGFTEALIKTYSLCYLNFNMN